jgi:hypothetical protein
VSLETPTWGTSSWHNGDTVEGRVAGTLWDLFDVTTDGLDHYTDDFVHIWDVLSNQTDDTFYDYFSTWRDLGYDSKRFVETAYQNTIDYRPAITFKTNPIDFEATQGSITINGSIYYHSETERFFEDNYTITANPPINYTFHHWDTENGAAVSNSNANPTNIHIASNGSLKAVFAAKVIFYTIPKDIGGIHWGTLLNPLQTNGDYIYEQYLLPDYANNLTVYAEPVPGYSFYSWEFTDGIFLNNSLENTASGNITGPGKLTVIYNADPVVVFIKAVSGDGRLDPGGNVSRGDNVRMLSRVADLETNMSDLLVTISYRPQGGAWVNVSATYQPNRGNWYYDWVIPGDAVVGLYDIMVNVSDPDGGATLRLETGEFNVVE